MTFSTHIQNKNPSKFSGLVSQYLNEKVKNYKTSLNIDEIMQEKVSFYKISDAKQANIYSRDEKFLIDITSDKFKKIINQLKGLKFVKAVKDGRVYNLCVKVNNKDKDIKVNKVVDIRVVLDRINGDNNINEMMTMMDVDYTPPNLKFYDIGMKQYINDQPNMIFLNTKKYGKSVKLCVSVNGKECNIISNPNDSVESIINKLNNKVDMK